jgi:hypothetical protein
MLYKLEFLKMLFAEVKIATLPQLKAALGTSVDMTVFRKLRELSYCTSYSHRGRYYTLTEIAEFDERGLWFYQSVCFSQYGRLLETAKFFITHAEAGYSTHELDHILQVTTQEPLLCLLRQGAVYRTKLATAYIYFAVEPRIRRRQILLRKDWVATVAPDATRLATIRFWSLLDEQQRRLYAGLEALKLGYGGDTVIADQLGLDVHTVAVGKQALLTDTYKTQGIRQAGAGRTPIKKSPGHHQPA